MENEKMKMIMMNEELFEKYADAARSKVIDKMHETAEKNGQTMSQFHELYQYMTMTIYITEFKKLLFDSGSDEEREE